MEDELFEKVWPRDLAISGYSGISVISVLFRFRCLMFVAGDFPVKRTIDHFLYRGTTVDFGDVCLAGVSFCSFNHTPHFGPDDSVIFNILLSRVLLHPFQSFISGFNR